MKTLSLLLAIALVPSCHTVPPPPPPSDVPSAGALHAADADAESLTVANIDAGIYAAGKITDPNVKAANLGAFYVLKSLHPGRAKEADSKFAMTLVEKALAGKLAEAEDGWAKERERGSAMSAKIATLEQQVKDERAAAATELQRQLTEANDKARQKAEAREQFFKTCLFFGGGVICLLGMVAIFALKAYLPMLGSNVALWFGAAGVMLILTGIVVRAIARLIEDHPYIFWGGIVSAGAAVCIAAGLIISNHHHAKAVTP